MSIDQVVNAIDTAIHKLPHIESLYEQAKDEAEKMQRTIQRLANHIMVLEHKISILDTTAFFCEQVLRRKHQEIQELIAQKNRIEKLITNILSDDNEGYSQLKQIVKENVKAVLSDNKEIISISFVALIQTIKADPQMVKLIQNMPSANNGEQHKDNDINIIKYLESNKDSILDLSEKNYENLVEELTNNAIALAAASFNPELSLSSSSSTFLGQSNQSGTYGKEQSEIYHNSKGDIDN